VVYVGIVFVVVIGGIMTGGSPMEAGSIGTLAVLIMAFAKRGRLPDAY
jgi:hypothetical protein